MSTLVLVGKPDCHLCHVMHEAVQRVVGDRLAIEERDVRSDPSLYERYRYEIPVLLLEGQEVARHHIDEETLRRHLEARGLL